MVLNTTWREQSVPLNQNDVTEIYFSDTNPNHIIFNNSTDSPLYVGTSANVGPNYYDMLVPIGATQIFARPSGMPTIYVWNAASVKKVVKLQSFVGEFTPGSINQTQTVINEQQLSGVMDIKSLPSLPPGGNRIGTVQAELIGELVSNLGLKVDLQGGNITISQASIGDMASKITTFSYTNQDASFMVDAYKNLTIELQGTATNVDVQFYGMMQSNALIPIMGVNLSDLSTGTHSTKLGQLWSFDITGLVQVLISIVTTNGTININGKAVA